MRYVLALAFVAFTCSVALGKQLEHRSWQFHDASWKYLSASIPLAASHGTKYPVVQGPMTRVSDTAEFALAVAQGGALPMVAFAQLKGQPLQTLLERSAELMAGKPWGIGLLGFAPQELLDEQLAMAGRFKPSYAIIAGGRPDQAVHLERAGIPTFLHVPASSLIPN